ncbi:Uma2 family endonuclease [Spirulina major]|uniref:Uma2 family endonuclease n=1 Tax=Spirulina major TaxID=270636 RepID=UPI0009354CD5|nr:Uma2 family endonuclease [Spirulina major]
MMLTSEKNLTLAEFLQLPETQPAQEYINGTIFQKPMPQGEHSAIQTELATAINLALKPEKIARAFTELRCVFDNRALVPDISVYRWTNIPRTNQGRIANQFDVPPDWVIEILSPQQSQTQVTKKILYCLQNVTVMGWLINPEVEEVWVFTPDQMPRICDRAEDQLPIPEFAQVLQLTVGELWLWLDEL